MKNKKNKITNFAINLDENTYKQFENCYKLDFVILASLMPDAHFGYVAPIGSVFVTSNYIVPSWVGYDIGCGMIACKFSKKNIVQLVRDNSKKIFDKINLKIPMGNGNDNSFENISDKTKQEFNNLIVNFKKGDFDKQVFNYITNSSLKTIGSLGSGNHFIELGEDGENLDDLWLIIHSGSRAVGHKIATYYMKQASGKEKAYEQTYPIKVDSNLGKEYINSLNFCLDFALLNRLEMANSVKEILREVLGDDKLEFELWTNKNHNHAIFENGLFVHRKGATAAKKGERGVIPANMRDGSFLVEGLGNNDFLESSSHGAGRQLSRIEAKKNISMQDFKNSMEKVVANVSEKTLDESPQAYKNITDVMTAQKKSVKIIAHIKPIINWKG